MLCTSAVEAMGTLSPLRTALSPGHNSQLLARVGQTVEAGDVIALSGSTGRSTGPHLHFGVRINGERTSPRSYLP